MGKGGREFSLLSLKNVSVIFRVENNFHILEKGMEEGSPLFLNGGMFEG